MMVFLSLPENHLTLNGLVHRGPIIIYGSRHFFMGYFVIPHAQIIFDLGGNIEGVSPKFEINQIYYVLVSMPLTICAQITGILAVAAEFLDRPERQKYLGWILNRLPKILSKILFPSLPKT
jgi:hypothetical protein